MVIGFSKQHGFREKILAGVKIHTIREDTTGRWAAGRKMHFAYGVRTKHYECFKKDVCRATQRIEIWYENKDSDFPIVTIDGRPLFYGNEQDFAVLWDLAINDGFEDINAFCRWFNKDFTGKIIHWTEKLY